MAVDIDSLQIEIEATSSDAAKKIEALTTALTGLKTAAKGGAGLTTTTKQLKALSEAAKLINGANLNSGKIKEFTAAMNSLAGIQKASGLSSAINALKNFLRLVRRSKRQTLVNSQSRWSRWPLLCGR